MESWSWPPEYGGAEVPTPESEYWFPERETMDPELRNLEIVKRIQAVMRYAYARSPFYRRKWDAAGIGPDDIRDLQTFEHVPVVTKEELRRSQEEAPPFGDYLCVPESDVVRVHGTSGTTGRPTAFAIGRDDWNAIATAHARVLWGMGVRPSDTVFVGSVFSLYMGSWGALLGAERLGATVFPFGAGVAGQSTRAVNWMRQMKPSVFYGTPSYALRLADVAADEGIDPREFGVRILFFSGEPGAAIPLIRRQIEELYGGKVFDSGSMAEMTPWMALGETRAQAGMLCWQDIVYTEVTDPNTHRRVPYGAQGTPVYTHLERTSQPMIRLLSGDLTTWVDGPSPCGRTYPRLPRGIFGRIDDQFTVRGENIIPSAIDEIVHGLADYGGEHRIIVTREQTMDVLSIQIEYGASLGSEQTRIDEFSRLARDRLQNVLGVGVQVTALRQNTLERTEFKARRVIDERTLLNEVLRPGGS